MKKNNTSRIIIAVVVVLLLIGGGYLFFGKSHMSPSQSADNAVPQNQSQQMTTGKKSLSDFFAMGGSQKCTFSDSTSNSSGTVYVNSGKMRGDFQSNNNGQSTQTHMINDGTFVYIWTEGKASGYKMSLASVKQEEAQVTSTPSNGNSGPQPSQAVNMQQKSNYSCGPWSVDSSVFTVPTNVTFTDFSSMMQGTTTNPAVHQGHMMQGNQAACSECDKAPAGAARNQCLSALKCQ